MIEKRWYFTLKKISLILALGLLGDGCGFPFLRLGLQKMGGRKTALISIAGCVGLTKLAALGLIGDDGINVRAQAPGDVWLPLLLGGTGAGGGDPITKNPFVDFMPKVFSKNSFTKRFVF